MCRFWCGIVTFLNFLFENSRRFTGSHKDNTESSCVPFAWFPPNGCLSHTRSAMSKPGNHLGTTYVPSFTSLCAELCNHHGFYQTQDILSPQTPPWYYPGELDPGERIQRYVQFFTPVPGDVTSFGNRAKDHQGLPATTRDWER